MHTYVHSYNNKHTYSTYIYCSFIEFIAIYIQRYMQKIYTNNTSCTHITLSISTWNSTACVAMRDNALHSAVSYSEQLILAQSLTGLVTIIALCYALYTAYTILTKRVFTQSMNDNINYLLLIPIALCAAMGGYCWCVSVT